MKLYTILCCAALALGSAVYAQFPVDHITVHFNTPVIVGETKLPAGDCDIRVAHGSSDNIILILRMQGGPAIETVASRFWGEDDDNTNVILQRQGNDLHLYRIQLPDHTGYQLY